MVPKCFGNPAVAKKVQSVGAFMIEILHLHRLNRLPVIIVVRFLIVNKKQEYNSYPLTTSSAIWRAAAFLLNAVPSIGTSKTSTESCSCSKRTLTWMKWTWCLRKRKNRAMKKMSMNWRPFFTIKTRCTFCSRSVSVPEPSEPFSGQETHWQLLSMFGHRRPFSFAYFAPHNLSKP